MTRTQLISLAPSCIAAVTAIIGMISSIKNRKRIQEVHILINSRLDQLLLAKEGLARAEGHTEGRIEAKTEQENKP